MNVVCYLVYCKKIASRFRELKLKILAFENQKFSSDFTEWKLNHIATKGLMWLIFDSPDFSTKNEKSKNLKAVFKKYAVFAR